MDFGRVVFWKLVELAVHYDSAQVHDLLLRLLGVDTDVVFVPLPGNGADLGAAVLLAWIVVEMEDINLLPGPAPHEMDGGGPVLVCMFLDHNVPFVVHVVGLESGHELFDVLFADADAPGRRQSLFHGRYIMISVFRH